MIGTTPRRVKRVYDMLGRGVEEREEIMPMFRCVVLAGAVLGLFLMVRADRVVAQDDVVREIVQIAGDLYRFRNNNHYAVFLVTPDGIIATDPINADAATWLKQQLRERFGVPVKYLVYSHEHADHISGGEVFADTATVVAHENTKAHIAAGGVATAMPQITFADHMTLELGGKTVELTYLGRNHSDSMIVMGFPAARAMFVVDIVGVDRMPYRDLPGAHLEGWIAALNRLSEMDFDILAPGHGSMGIRADVAAHRRYFEDLRDTVRRELAAGKSLDEIKAAATLDGYKDWLQYDAWQQLNVEGMVRILRE